MGRTKHEVTYSIPEREVGSSNVVFKARENDKRLGKLLVSKGSIDWVPVNGRYGYVLRWCDLAQLAENEGKRHRPMR